MMPSRRKLRNLKIWQLTFRVLVTTESLEINVQFSVETWGTNTDLLTILLHVHEKYGDGSGLFDKHNLVPVKIVCNNDYIGHKY